MKNYGTTLSERAAMELRGLYESCGYTKYRMSKFEDYELYVRNKSFLVSENIITFTDIGGKLKALKPDVTLSIAKNCKGGDGVTRLYYNENVYRVPHGGFSFKEIMQMGLELIGNVDRYATLEVLSLACESLALIGEWALDVSDVGIVSDVIAAMGADMATSDAIFKCVGEKNLHGIDALCASANIDRAHAERLKRLLTMKSDGSELLEILGEGELSARAEELLETVGALGGNVRIDMSVVDDTSYYSGIVFKGFIKGIPTSVLSGGRYDNLMKKLGRRVGAIGFAIYLDTLDTLEDTAPEFDADVLLVYKECDKAEAVLARVKEIRNGGESVCALRAPVGDVRAARVEYFNGGDR